MKIIITVFIRRIAILVLLTGSAEILANQFSEAEALVGVWTSDQQELGSRTKTALTLNANKTFEIKGNSGAKAWGYKGKWRYYNWGIRLHSPQIRGSQTFDIKGIDKQTIEFKFRDANRQYNGMVRTYKRTTPVPDWLDYNHNSSDNISVGLTRHVTNKQYCDQAILARAKNTPIDSRLGPIKLVAQNAGLLLCSHPDFTIHEQGNFLPEKIDETGPARCHTFKAGKKHESVSSILVAVVDKPVDFKLTRRWMWDSIGKVVRNEILPTICPEATTASVRVYIKGHDITRAGIPYNTVKIDFPLINKPSYTAKDVHKTYGTINPHWEYDQTVNQYISFGVVLASFKGPAYKSKMCEQHDSNCSFSTFSPNYYARSNGYSMLPNLRERLSWGKNTKAILKKIKEYELYFDENTTFISYSKAARKIHLNDERIRKQNEKRMAIAIKAYKARQALNKVIEKEGFWKLFALGLQNGMALDAAQCSGKKSQGDSIPWYCHEYFPDDYPANKY